MFIGGCKIGKIKDLKYEEMAQIIKNLPSSIKYSYKCTLHSMNWASTPLRYTLYLFRNKD